VIAWNAPGARSSSDPPETFTTAGYVHCLGRFLDALGIDRAHILGLSWGGILAQEFYRLHHKRFRSLVLADTYAGWKGSLSETVWRERLSTCLQDSSGPPKSLIAKFLPSVFNDSAPQHLREELSTIVAEFHPVGFRVMSLSSAAVDTRDMLPTIEVPTLLLWGEYDRRSPLEVAAQFKAAIPSAELVVIPNAGHVSNMEQPAVFNGHVRRFCFSV
jgi:pimeloyl-ACP methyl ester carboxylesterase